MPHEKRPSPLRGPEDPIALVERAMVRIRRSQSKRTLGRMMERESREPISQSRAFVVDALDEAREGHLRDVGVGDVADLLGIDQSRASRMVADAIEAGDVTRVASQADGRRVGLQLTEQGRTLARTSRRFRMSVFSRVLQSWPEADRATFARLLARFTEALDVHRRQLDEQKADRRGGNAPLPVELRVVARRR